MKNLKRFLLICLIMTGLYSCGEKPIVIPEENEEVPETVPELIYAAPENKEFRRVGYFPYYRDLSEFGIPDSTILRLDIACFAFAEIQQDFTVKLHGDAELYTLVRRCKELGVKVLLSFNGDHSIYAEMVKKEKTRAIFINSVMQIVDAYGLDGVDNDWEYPSTKDASSTGNLYLMREFSNILHAPNVNKFLTAAITCGKYVGAYSNGILSDCFPCLDWCNVMVYDDFSTTQAGIAHSPMSLMETAYKYWVETRKMPLHKFVGGIPIYGRASGITQKGTVLTYKNIIEQGGDPDKNEAMVTSSSYNNGNTPYMIYYNGRPLVREKTRYCLDKGVGGIMFWEAGQDTKDSTSIIKAAYDEIFKEAI